MLVQPMVQTLCHSQSTLAWSSQILDIVSKIAWPSPHSSSPRFLITSLLEQEIQVPFWLFFLCGHFKFCRKLFPISDCLIKIWVRSIFAGLFLGIPQTSSMSFPLHPERYRSVFAPTQMVMVHDFLLPWPLHTIQIMRQHSFHNVGPNKQGTESTGQAYLTTHILLVHKITLTEAMWPGFQVIVLLR